MAWLTAPFIVLGGLTFAAVVIAIHGEPLFERRTKELEPPPHNPMVVCKGCGDTYHESWGWICPNCSGAD